MPLVLGAQASQASRVVQPVQPVQSVQSVRLESFTSDSAAEGFLVRVAEIHSEERLRIARENPCRQRGWELPRDAPPCKLQLQLNETTVVVPMSTQLITVFDAIPNAEHTGSGVQRLGSRVLALRSNERRYGRNNMLSLIDLSSRTPRVTGSLDAQSPVADYWSAIDPEFVAWGRVVAVLDHGEPPRRAILRTFTIGDRGQLTPRDTLVLSGTPPTGRKNMALRLVGSRMVMYTAWAVPTSSNDVLPYLAAVVPSDHEGFPRDEEWQDAVRPARVFHPVEMVDTLAVNTIHGLVVCDLATPQLDCATTTLLAPYTRTFAMTDSAFYIVTRSGPLPPALRRHDADSSGSLFVSVPMNGDAPTAFLVNGEPIDRRAVRESGATLSALMVHRDSVQATVNVAAAWKRALLTVHRGPDRTRTEGSAISAQTRVLTPNRGPIQYAQFAGDYVFHVTDSFIERKHDTLGAKHDTISVAHTPTGREWRVSVGYQIDRVVPLGAHALLLGEHANTVRATLMRLDSAPVVVRSVELPNAAPSRENTLVVHRSDPDSTDHYRLGYSVVLNPADTINNEFGYENALWFVDVRGTTLTSLGVLRVDEDKKRPHDSVAGLAQAVFLGDRVFGVFFGEVVEGRVVNGRVRETGRTPLPLAPAH